MELRVIVNSSQATARRSYDISPIDIAVHLEDEAYRREALLDLLAFSGPPGVYKSIEGAHIDASSGTTWVVFSSRRSGATS